MPIKISFKKEKDGKTIKIEKQPYKEMDDDNPKKKKKGMKEQMMDRLNKKY